MGVGSVCAVVAFWFYLRSPSGKCVFPFFVYIRLFGGLILYLGLALRWQASLIKPKAADVVLIVVDDACVEVRLGLCVGVRPVGMLGSCKP